jgi:hypothetical protein
VLPEHVKVEEILSFVDIPAAEATALAKREWQRYDPLSELPLGIAMDKTHYRLAEQFLADGTANGVFAFYFRGLDIICHAGLQYSNLYPDTPVSAEDRKRYGNLVSRYYAYTLAQLRRLIEQAGEGTVVIIVSDHGFERLGESAFGHDNAPPGVLAVLGGGSPPGFSNAPPAVVYDVAPTILWLSGYPVAADMPGHPLKELYPRFETQVARVDPPRTYGYRWYEPPLTLATEKGADQEMMNLLRTLGYIK